MAVTIRLLGLFRQYGPPEPWEVPAGERSIGELLAEMEEKAHAGYIPIVNGERKSKAYVPEEGDEIKIMPLVTGG